MAHVVLVAGAGLGAWAWEQVAPRLEQAGHRVDAHTLPGLADRADEGDADTGLAAHVEDLAAAVERPGEPVVLVAHSYAGAVASGVVRLVPERIAHGIWLAGAVLEPGQRLYDLMPPEAQEMIEAQARESGGRVPFMSPELLDAFFGAHGLDTDDMSWLQQGATATPVGSYREPLDITGDVTVTRTYVHCVGDGPGAPVEPDDGGWERRDLPTGHWPMRTLPQRTAALIHEVATATR